MNKKPQMSWKPIRNCLLLGIPIWLIIGFLIFLAIGCGPGYQVILRPDVYVSGNFSPYYPNYYETYYPLTIVTIVNGTPDELQIIRDGEKLTGNIAPGQHFKLEIRIDYRETRKISLIALAYRDKKLRGTAERSFHFYGNPREQRSETWLIRTWDIRDP